MSSEVITRNPEISIGPFFFAKELPLADIFSDEGRESFEDKDRIFIPPEFVRRAVLLDIVVNQNDSQTSSVERYIAGLLLENKEAIAVHTQKIGDSLHLYTLIEGDNDEMMDGLLEQERFFYTRFPELDVEFHILLGKEAEDLLPTGSVLLLKKT